MPDQRENGLSGLLNSLTNCAQWVLVFVLTTLYILRLCFFKNVVNSYFVRLHKFGDVVYVTYLISISSAGVCISPVVQAFIAFTQYKKGSQT